MSKANKYSLAVGALGVLAFIAAGLVPAASTALTNAGMMLLGMAFPRRGEAK